MRLTNAAKYRSRYLYDHDEACQQSAADNSGVAERRQSPLLRFPNEPCLSCLRVVNSLCRRHQSLWNKAPRQSQQTTRTDRWRVTTNAIWVPYRKTPSTAQSLSLARGPPRQYKLQYLQYARFHNSGLSYQVRANAVLRSSLKNSRPDHQCRAASLMPHFQRPILGRK